VDRNGNGRLVMRRSEQDLLCKKRKKRTSVLFSRIWSASVKVTRDARRVVLVRSVCQRCNLSRVGICKKTMGYPVKPLRAISMSTINELQLPLQTNVGFCGSLTDE
jgi:hypothetical protein